MGRWEFPYRNLWNISSELPGLLRFDVGRPDHFCPFLGFVGDELSEVGGRDCKRRAAQVGKAGFHLEIGEPRIGDNKRTTAKKEARERMYDADPSYSLLIHARNLFFKATIAKTPGQLNRAR